MKRPEAFSGEAWAISVLAAVAIVMWTFSSHMVILLSVAGHNIWAAFSLVWAYFWGFVVWISYRDSQGQW